MLLRQNSLRSNSYWALTCCCKTKNRKAISWRLGWWERWDKFQSISQWYHSEQWVPKSGSSPFTSCVKTGREAWRILAEKFPNMINSSNPQIQKLSSSKKDKGWMRLDCQQWLSYPIMKLWPLTRLPARTRFNPRIFSFMLNVLEVHQLVIPDLTQIIFIGAPKKKAKV